jgi:hypothetical protein
MREGILIQWLTPPKLDHTRSNLRSGLLRDSDGSDHLGDKATAAATARIAAAPVAAMEAYREHSFEK